MIRFFCVLLHVKILHSSVALHYLSKRFCPRGWTRGRFVVQMTVIWPPCWGAFSVKGQWMAVKNSLKDEMTKRSLPLAIKSSWLSLYVQGRTFLFRGFDENQNNMTRCLEISNEKNQQIMDEPFESILNSPPLICWKTGTLDSPSQRLNDTISIFERQISIQLVDNLIGQILKKSYLIPLVIFSESPLMLNFFFKKKIIYLSMIEYCLFITLINMLNIDARTLIHCKSRLSVVFSHFTLLGNWAERFLFIISTDFRSFKIPL